MLPGEPCLGVRFDINKVSSPYGLSSWTVFWSAVRIKDLSGALLFAGDTAATLSGRENVYCIAIQGVGATVWQKIRTALEGDSEFQKVAATPQFVQGVIHEPLPSEGQIDLSGNFTGKCLWSATGFERACAVKEKKASRMIRFPCPKCQRQLKAADEQAGKTVKCPKCGHRIAVPGIEQSSERTASPQPASQRQGSAGVPRKSAASGEAPMSTMPSESRMALSCPHCGQTCHCGVHLVGKPMVCPHCDKVMTVPSNEPAAAEMGTQTRVKEVHAWIEGTAGDDLIRRILAGWKPELIDIPGVQFFMHCVPHWSSNDGDVLRLAAADLRDNFGIVVYPEHIKAPVWQGEFEGKRAFVTVLDRLSVALRSQARCDRSHLKMVVSLCESTSKLLKELPGDDSQNMAAIAFSSSQAWSSWRNEIKTPPMLEGTDLNSLQLTGAHLEGARLRSANLNAARGGMVFFANADLTDATLVGFFGVGVFLTEAKCHRADFSKAKLLEVDLSGGDFSGAKFVDAEFTINSVDAKATFVGADFTGCCVDEGSAESGAIEALVSMLSHEQRTQLKVKTPAGCFVATACCGSVDAWQVVLLRLFRDRILKRSVLGRRLIELYYAASPPLARRIQRHPALQRLFRTLLVTPAAGIAALLVRDSLRDKQRPWKCRQRKIL